MAWSSVWLVSNNSNSPFEARRLSTSDKRVNVIEKASDAIDFSGLVSFFKLFVGLSLLYFLISNELNSPLNFWSSKALPSWLNLL